MTAQVLRLPTPAERLARAAAPLADQAVEHMAARGCAYAVLVVHPCGHGDVWPRRSLGACVSAVLSFTLCRRQAPPPEPPPGARLLVVTERDAGWLTLEQLARLAEGGAP